MDCATSALQARAGIPAAVWWTAGQNHVDHHGVLAFLTSSDILSFSLGSTELLGLGSSVRHLKVRRAAGSTADFARLVQRLAGIRSIDLSVIRDNFVNVLVSIIAEHCTALASLNVGGCTNLTDASITAIAEHCTALTSLNVFGCDKLTDAQITAIKGRCPALTICV